MAALGRKELHTFHDTHYVPGNMTIAVVGDVDPAQVRRTLLQQLTTDQAEPCTTAAVQDACALARSSPAMDDTGLIFQAHEASAACCSCLLCSCVPQGLNMS